MAKLKLPEKLSAWMKKYRYALLILALGMLLMSFPVKRDTKQEETELSSANAEEKTSMQDQIAEILSKVDGAGEVAVLLSVSEGEKTLYQTDEEIASSSTRVETVVITGADRAQTCAVYQILPEKYEGAVIVCQGGDNAAVRLAMVDAVAKLTGLGADKITVLKMK